jgi:hypothetical protein
MSDIVERLRAQDTADGYPLRDGLRAAIGS